MSKLASVLLIELLAVSSLVMVGSVFAQSTAKPSVPDFTLQLEDGWWVRVIVQNQPVASNGHDSAWIFYDVRYKWRESANWYHPSESNSGNYIGEMDTSGTTEWVMSVTTFYELLGTSDSNQLEYQIRAINGYKNTTPAYGGPPLGHDPGDYPVVIINTSGWSETQTISIPATPPSSPEPTAPVPEFTVKLVNHPYDIPTTYSTDPYTGENITHAGYRVDNKSIEITVKNQPITSDGSGTKIYYNVCYKGHYEENWRNFFTIDNYPVQSVSEYTVISLPRDHFDFPVRAEVDFQVQALIGTVKLVEARLWGGFNYYEFDGETSRWSETQTLLIGESQTPSPEPTSTPPDELANMHPHPMPWVDVILTIAVIVAVLGAGLGLLIYLSKRK
jgi:hypothetical protein